MKKIFLASLALSSLASAAAFAEGGPVITEKSRQTFTVQLRGLALRLPVELQDRIRVTKAETGADILNLDAAIDFSATLKDPHVHTSTETTGWGDMQIIARDCQAKDALFEHLNSLGRLRRLESKVVSIKTPAFKGYMVETNVLSGSDLDFVDLKLVDESQKRCFSFNLTAQDFAPFSDAGVKAAISPLSNAIKASFTAYAEGNVQ